MLVVDDEADVVTAIRELLEAELPGVRVVAARGGAEPVLLLRDAPPDPPRRGPAGGPGGAAGERSGKREPLPEEGWDHFR